jgi:HK97 family phage major capsid protein
VAEATLKPQSSIAYTKVTASMMKIAHFVDVSEEAMTDFPAFTQLLSQDMIGGLIDAENNELLNAFGTARATSRACCK